MDRKSLEKFRGMKPCSIVCLSWVSLRLTANCYLSSTACTGLYLQDTLLVEQCPEWVADLRGLKPS
eukprot:5808969-Amphidinium_carterae.3